MILESRKDIVVVGGSTGSTAPLKQMLAGLLPDFPASIFISTHIPAHSVGMLAEVLQGATTMPVTKALDGQSVEPGHAYVATPDRHMLLLDDVIRLGTGPRENMARPSIDPLFRSAALSYGSRTVGVILSGMLDDGASGLHAIKSVGGTAVVQNPLEAEADEMPLAAMQATDVDYVLPATDLARLLTDLAHSRAGPQQLPSDNLRLEVAIAAGAGLGSEELALIATPVPMTCPDCHGVLSEVRGGRPLRFRCQVGHAFTAEACAASTTEVDDAVRVALRVMEERVTLVRRMAQDARQTGRTSVAELYENRIVEYCRHAGTLRKAAIATLQQAIATKKNRL